MSLETGKKLKTGDASCGKERAVREVELNEDKSSI